MILVLTKRRHSCAIYLVLYPAGCHFQEQFCDFSHFFFFALCTALPGILKDTFAEQQVRAKFALSFRALLPAAEAAAHHAGAFDQQADRAGDVLKISTALNGTVYQSVIPLANLALIHRVPRPESEQRQPDEYEEGDATQLEVGVHAATNSSYYGSHTR